MHCSRWLVLYVTEAGACLWLKARSRQLGDKNMIVTEKDVTYVADLANLELTDQERVSLAKDLNSILEFVDRLNELDTSDVPPMAQVSDRYGAPEKTGGERFASAMRADLNEPSLPREAALQNAPDSNGTFFKVPKVIEK
jgi:aspartyl-tRNA(Asn)/glutamyl-tRNA(Gln) amidotransferase subunit C